MKKKHRDITVEGVQYGWITKEDDKQKNTRVFKEGKEWFSFKSVTNTVNPELVASMIKNELHKQ